MHFGYRSKKQNGLSKSTKKIEDDQKCLRNYCNIASNYNIMGPTGPLGPTGPSNGISAYGGRYNNTSQTVTIGVGTQTQISLANTMPNRNVAYTTANSINISSADVYEINYYSNLSAAVATTITITMSIRVNGNNIPSTIITRALSVGVSSIYSGSTIVTLAPGDVIDIAVSALLSVGLTLGNGINASLSVKRLN